MMSAVAVCESPTAKLTMPASWGQWCKASFTDIERHISLDGDQSEKPRQFLLEHQGFSFIVGGYRYRFQRQRPDERRAVVRLGNSGFYLA